MSNVQNEIDKAIAEAQNSAANLPAEASGMTAGAVSAVGVGGTPLGLDDMMAGGISVDHWLKVTSDGLKVNESALLEELDVFINMSDIAYNYTIKYGNPAVYEKTYDLVKTSKGQPWAVALVQAKKVDTKANPYRSCDLPMVLAADVLARGKKDATAQAGQTIGYSESTTGYKFFEGFVKRLQQKGICPKTAVVKVKIGFKEQQKAGVNPWGVLTFGDFEEVGLEDLPDAP